MSKTYGTYKTALQSKLSALLGMDGEALFAGVYMNHEEDVDGFPSAFIVESAGDGSIIDNGRNEREWQFEIFIHHEVGKKNKNDVSDAIIDALDRVIASFDEDPMLKDSNGQPQCKKVRVVPVDIEFGEREGGYARAVVQVSIVDIVSRYS